MLNNTSRLGYIKAAIGLIQGIAIYLFDTKIICPEAFIVVLFVPMVVVQALGNMQGKTLAIWCVSLTAILTCLTYYNIWRTGLAHINSSLSFDLVVVCFIGIFIAQSLVSAGYIDKKWYPSYTTCFDVSWKMATQIFLSMTFLSISWALLGLSTLLLTYVSIPLDQIVNKPWYPFAFSAFVLAIALHLTDVKLAMLRALRVLYLNFISALLPVTVLVVTVFLLGELFSLLRHSGKTISPEVLEGIFLFLIVEINAVYLDGKNALIKGTSKQKYTSYAAKYLLLPLVGIIIVLRAHDISRDGITVYYIYDLAFIFLLTFYAIGYAIAGFTSATWLKGLELCNYIGALLVLAVILALYSPLVDPARIAISFQEKRYAAGQTNALNSTYRLAGLRWGVAAGKKYNLKQAEQPWAIPKTPAPVYDKTKRIYLHGAGKTLPASFMQQEWNTPGFTIACLQSASGPVCDAWLMKVGDDTQEGVLLFDPGQFVFYYVKLVNDKWLVAGSWKLTSRCFAEVTAIMKGEFTFIKVPQMPNIEVQGFQAVFQPTGQICPEVHLDR